MRRKKRRSHVEVELNLAAMLDMAFQLLTFFILTFRPSAIEGEIMLQMPPPRPVTTVPNGQSPGSDAANTNPVQGLSTITITVLASPDGQIDGLSIGESSVASVDALGARLHDLLADTQAGFDQVLIQAESNLSYQALMDVVDVCARQDLPKGGKLAKLGFVEIATN